MEDLGKNSVELRPNSTRIHSDANFCQNEFVLGGNKEFVHEREDLEQGVGRPTLGFCRAGAQGDDPSCRVVAVVGQFFDALVRHGREDRVIPLANSLTLADWIPNSQLHVFGHCGHWTQIEHAGRFARLVGDFLAEADIPT